MQHSTIVLVDGMNSVYRTAYTHIGLATSKGQATGSIYGTLAGVARLRHHVKSECDVIVFWEGDAPVPEAGKVSSWRSKIFKEYKAQRKRDAAAVDARSQVPYLLSAFNILRYPQIYVPGLEADDMIGIMARKLESKSCVKRIIILSTDKDFFQCVSKKIQVMRMLHGHAEIITPRLVKRQFGIGPELFAQYKALVGDSSDNYKGAPGVGPANAVAMLQAGVRPEYSSWSQHSKTVQSTYGKKLEEHWSAVHLCYKLAAIPTSLNNEFISQSLRIKGREQMTAALEQLQSMCVSRDEYNKLMKRWTKFCSKFELSTLIADRRRYLQHLIP